MLKKYFSIVVVFAMLSTFTVPVFADEYYSEDTYEEADMEETMDEEILDEEISEDEWLSSSVNNYTGNGFLDGSMSSGFGTTFSTNIPFQKTQKKMDGNLLVHVLDVERADSILLQTDHSAILIDSGKKHCGGDVASYLKSLGIEKLDAYIVTHAHVDHYGGSIGISEFLPFDVCYTSSTKYLPKDIIDSLQSNGKSVSIPNNGDVIWNSDGLKLTVVYNGCDFVNTKKSINDQSIVIRADYGERSFLLTGDACSPAQQKMVNGPYAHLLDCDVLKVPHHGTAAVRNDFLNKVTPAISVISTGQKTLKNNSPVVKKLRGVSKVYITKSHGTMIFATDGERIDVRTYVTPHTVAVGTKAWNCTRMAIADFYESGNPVACISSISVAHNYSLPRGFRMKFEGIGNNVSWTSSDFSRVQISENGVIECVGKGTAYIYYKFTNNRGRAVAKKIKITVQ